MKTGTGEAVARRWRAGPGAGLGAGAGALSAGSLADGVLKAKAEAEGAGSAAGLAVRAEKENPADPRESPGGTPGTEDPREKPEVAGGCGVGVAKEKPNEVAAGAARAGVGVLVGGGLRAATNAEPRAAAGGGAATDPERMQECKMTV